MDSFLANSLALLQTVLIALGFALFYSFTTYLFYKIGFIATLPFIFSDLGILLYRSLLTLGGKYLIDRIPSYDFMLYTLPMQILYFVFEITQYLLVICIAWLCLKHFHRAPATKEATNQSAFPFRKPLDLSNPILSSLFFVSLAVTALNVGSRIIYDIGYGAPTSLTEILQMIVAYGLDILLYGVLLFFAMRCLVAWAETKYQSISS